MSGWIRRPWPQQAKLADIARKYERAEDQQSYEGYKAWLKAGVEPDEAENKKPENERRPVALVWYGTAERTEAVYSDLFGK